MQKKIKNKGDRAIVHKDSSASSKKPKSDVYFIATLKKVITAFKGENISLRDILHHLKDDGLMFLIVIMALPTCIPVPTPPGFTTLFGIPLCVLTIQMVYSNGSTWLPGWLGNRQVKASTFKHVIDKAQPYFNKANKFLKPRYERFLTRNIERLAGILCFLSAVAITLPIIFGNWVPSIGILVTAIGFLYKDGLAVIVGMSICVIGLLICVAVVVTVYLIGLSAFKALLPSILHFSS